MTTPTHISQEQIESIHARYGGDMANCAHAIARQAIANYIASKASEPAPTAGERYKTIERLKYLSELVWQITAEDKRALLHAAALLQSLASPSVAVGVVEREIWIKGLLAAAHNAIGCFKAAKFEGLMGALAETTDTRLKDLVERRLMYAPEYLSAAIQGKKAALHPTQPKGEKV